MTNTIIATGAMKANSTAACPLKLFTTLFGALGSFDNRCICRIDLYLIITGAETLPRFGAVDEPMLSGVTV
jgi:hypothetical protein